MYCIWPKKLPNNANAVDYQVFAKENCTEITCIPTSYDKSLTPQSYNPVSLDISDIEILNVNDYGKIVLQMVIRLFLQDFHSNICYKIFLEILKHNLHVLCKIALSQSMCILK